MRCLLENILCALLVSVTTSPGQNLQGQTELNDWYGFKKRSFLVEGKEAYVVIPEQPLPGNPWIWRARFPEWHDKIDSTLVSSGYHIAFINTSDMYGSPEAMEIWDSFYQYLTTQEKLNSKVILFGVSRGGLFIYTWAKKHPDRISAICAESPVCDFKSWPLGFGKSAVSPEDSVKLMKAYGFGSVREAVQYDNNPVDNLEILAGKNIPIMHVFGLNDRIVPPDENTLQLAARYKRLGGEIVLIPNTRGKESLEGHHFELDDPESVVQFILKNTYSASGGISSSNFHQIRRGLGNCRLKFVQEKNGSVAFLGGSITYNPGWRDSVCDHLQNWFPDTRFDFVEAGIPSMGSMSGAFRLGRDILDNGHVDLLFVEAAVNDRSIGRTAAEQMRGMEGIVRHAGSVNPLMDIVVMHFVDPGKMEEYNQGNIPDEIRNHEKVAEHYGIPTINLAKEVTDRINAGEFTWEEDFKNLHPSPFGQRIYANSIITFLESCWFGKMDPSNQLTEYKQPHKLDTFCYDNGEFLSVHDIDLRPGWSLDSNWVPADDASTRNGYVNIPVLVTAYPAATLTMDFQGKAVGAVIIAGPDAGIMEFSIDGSPFKRIDLFTRWSKDLHLPRYCMFSDDLHNGQHTLELRISSDKNSESTGRACRIESFFINR